MKGTTTQKRTLWQNMKRKVQTLVIRIVRSCISRYIEWRLDRGLPITGSGLRYIERKLSSAVNQCREMEENTAVHRTYAINR